MKNESGYTTYVGFTTIVVILILIVGLLGGFLKLFNQNDYVVTITEKEVKRSDDSDKYLIFGKLEDNSVKVFENSDVLLKGKFNSSTVQASLEVGKTYKLSVIGWRVGVFSMYENIVSFEEINNE